MDNMVYREINFDSIVLGTLISADCEGRLQCSKTELAFQLNFRSEQNKQIKFPVNICDVRKIFKTLADNQMILDFKLKPATIKTIGDLIRGSGFYFQISKNSEEAKFQIYLNDISSDDISFIEKFFSSIDVFDENVAKIMKEPEPQQQQSSKNHKPNLFKPRKKKLLDLDPEDGSQDYHPQKRPRKQSFSKVNADCEVIEEATPKRSLRVRNRDEVNLCEEMSEDAQLQEALKRSLKGVDPIVIESLSHIEDQKSEKDLEHDEIYDNVDKTIELFTYSTSNGDIIVRMEDYLCLSRNEYLSDVIIDFYLHYIYNVKMTQEQREKTLIIGTHFYTLYATPSEYSGWNDGLNYGLNAKEKRYRRIDGILKNDVNIFEKDYIIMPLMDHNHWFLAIVCFPKLNGSYTIDGNVKIDENDIKRNPKKIYQPPIKSSCILIFDSVKGNGSRRTVAINHIKNFLEYEWMNKYQQEFHFDVKCLNGHSPKVPLQMNNVDCGCFILEFMERFFVTSPIEDFRFPIDLLDWFLSEEVRSSKRRELAEVIKNVMEANNNHVELPKIRFYGDRKRKSSKIVQYVDLDSSVENNNNNNNNENMDDTFRVPENGNGINGNNNNANNNDENFNNNNDFNCLDSNNILQNGNAMLENQDAVHNITRDEEYIEANVERVTTQELMDYQQECYFHEDGKTESVVLDTSDEMDVNESPDNGIETAETVKKEANGLKSDAETPNNDVNDINEDANVRKVDSNFHDSFSKFLQSKKTINDPEVVKSDEDIQKSDKTIKEKDLNIQSDKKLPEIEVEKKDSESSLEIYESPPKIDLTLDDCDDNEEEPNNKISDIIKDDEMDIESAKQNNDDQEPENQKSENMQSIADRISQSITLKESTSVLLD
ncbi:hypothetical protein ACKWTF_013116 [Chironomus riparius]